MAERQESLQELPASWRKSFGCLGDECLHLLARLYLSQSSQQKTHSRELIIEALWHHANRDEYRRASLQSLNDFDTQLLLSLYLGLHNIEQLSASLPEHSVIEICLQLLHLQERMLVLQVDEPRPKRRHASHSMDKAEKIPRGDAQSDRYKQREPAAARPATESQLHLIPKFEKQGTVAGGASFVIAPQFIDTLQRHLDFSHLFKAVALSQAKRQELRKNAPKLLLSSELLLASALYFGQTSSPFRRKISKAQLAKCQNCFPQLDAVQLQELNQMGQACGLLREGAQQELVFSREDFVHLWRSPYYQRLLSLQAHIVGLHPNAFAQLLFIWTPDMMLPDSQLRRLLSRMGLAAGQTAVCIAAMLRWQILCPADTQPPCDKAADHAANHAVNQEAYYLFNPRLYESILGTEAQRTETGPSSRHTQSNRLSSNWELYCDLRHPESYIDLLLCARLESFGELSLFRIEKALFQQYFNAEERKFERFIQHLPQLENNGIHISEFFRQQWQEWFNDSTRFQLFKGALLVCQPSYNELISRLLENPKNPDILCNPQPGVFFLNEERQSFWRDRLNHAGIYCSEPFTTKASVGNLSNRQTTAAATGSVIAACPEIAEPIVNSLDFPINAISEKLRKFSHDKAISLPQFSPTTDDTETARDDDADGKPASFLWDNWPASPQSFVNSRRLVCCNSDLRQLHIHFREARGVYYTAKRNLLHSLLTARNHMAIITVAEGDDFDLVPYTVLPLNLTGNKEDPELLALELRLERLMSFRVKNITRVNEVFYSLINVCLLSLLPADYICRLEAEFVELENSAPKAFS